MLTPPIPPAVLTALVVKQDGFPLTWPYLGQQAHSTPNSEPLTSPLGPPQSWGCAEKASTPSNVGSSSQRPELSLKGGCTSQPTLCSVTSWEHVTVLANGSTWVQRTQTLGGGGGTHGRGRPP